MTELNPEESAKLKDDGNKLFAGKQFSQAHDKYTKALKVGGGNAIIYANRSACCMSMGRYLDACSDARKATELDSEYVKGWGRLGAAEQELGNWRSATDAYEKALSKLPSNGWTAAEKRQKDQYEASLNIAKEKVNSPARKVHGVPAPGKGQFPWERAEAILKAAERNGTPEEWMYSSVGPIVMAAGDYKEALAGMRQMRKMTMPGDMVAVSGRLDVLENLTNAILSDRRAFYIDNSNWIGQYNEQVLMEAEQSRAWPHDGPEVILAEAQKRVKESGWDATRRAISVTVRGWITRAHLCGGLTKDHTEAVHFYRNAIDVLERGRVIWAGVSKDDRGAIFEETFLYGVRSLHLEAFMEAYAATHGTDPRFSAEILDELATKLISDVDAMRERRVLDRRLNGESFWLAYYVYPAADACAIKAYALKKQASGKPIGEYNRLWTESGEYYWQAAERYPKDDEYHCSHIMNALGSWWMVGNVPLKKTVPLLAQLQKNAPRMKQIWEHSGFAMGGRDKKIEKCLDFYEEIKGKMATGALSENDIYNPSFQI